ncbi:MAG: alpha/beta hydrolase [Propionibacteriaceae bacterium]|jgi:acetyl esterase/lipase|nr:alpha/beta hydrolase [Propionibacteriaceae bacterium]
MNGRRKVLDVAYADGSPAQRLDLYLPDGGDGLFPLVVHVHGGGFAFGDKADEHLDTWLALLDRGWAVASANYRMSGEAPFPAAVLDCRAAVRWLKANWRRLGIDPRRVIALGGSAGGNLAALLAMNVANGAFPGEDPDADYAADATVAGAVDLFGPTDFAAMDRQARANGVSLADHDQPDSPESRYLGRPVPEAGELVAQANPATYVSPHMSPLFIQHGDRDVLVPHEQSARLADAIRRGAGEAKVTFQTLPGAGHDDPAFSAPANLDAIVAFIERAAPALPYAEARLAGPDEFPESTWTADGMAVLEADLALRHGSALLGVEYARKDGRALHLQVLLPPLEQAPPDDPASRAIRFPLVVYVQGSAWREQVLGAALPALAEFATRGYVVAIVEYRPSSVAPFPAQVKDARSAVRFLRDHAEDFHVDPARIAVWGDSSGAHTTVMLNLTEADPDYSDEPADDLGVACYVDFYGPMAIARMNEEPSIQDHIAPDSPEGELIGGRDVWANPLAVAPTVAMNHIDPGRPPKPLLILHGSQDRLVPFAQSVLLYEALQAAGAPVTFYQLRGAGHGGPAFWQPPVLDLVDAFLRGHLPQAG